MKKIFWILPLLFFSTSLFGEKEAPSEKTPIRIALETESLFSSVYVGNLPFEGNEFSKDYLSELEKILSFDLKMSGVFQLLPSTPEKERLLEKTSENAFPLKTWKNHGAQHVIKMALSNKMLSLQIFSTQSGHLAHFPPVSLSGSLSRDRRSIHKVADAIHKTVFGKEGVASKKILYSKEVPDSSLDRMKWPAEIWECDWDGGNATQITSEKSYCITPAAFPNNKKFLYVSYKIGQPKILVSSSGKKQGERFLSIRGNQLLPAISPKGDKMAFICDASGRADLFLQNLDEKGNPEGKPIQLFSYPRSTQASPTFNADGTYLAFVSDKEGFPRVYTIPTSSSKKLPTPTLVARETKQSSCPAWSSDGKKIAFSAKTQGTRQIWIYDCETKKEWQLTQGTGDKENPSWAPNSLHIIYNSIQNNSSDLYLINLNQKQPIKITSGLGKKHYPSWER